MYDGDCSVFNNIKDLCIGYVVFIGGIFDLFRYGCLLFYCCDIWLGWLFYVVVGFNWIFKGGICEEDC